MIFAAQGPDRFPTGRLHRVRNQSGTDSDSAAGSDHQPLVRNLDPDKTSGIAEVIAVNADAARFRHDGQVVVHEILLAVLARRQPNQVVRKRDFAEILIGSGVGDFVEELSHAALVWGALWLK